MADITLAEFNGRVWLVGGETHLHDLLGNTLPKDVSIELIQCEHPSAIRQLWVQHCGEPEGDGMPWHDPSRHRRAHPSQHVGLRGLFRRSGRPCSTRMR